MKSHLTITSIIAVLLALAALVPASAPASSLLSGYGGPGQGNQAILGSALLNGPSGGGGGSAGGVPSVASSTSNGAGASERGGAGAGPRGHRHAAVGHAKQGSGAGTGASESAPRTYQRYAQTGSSQSAAADSGALGLSGSDYLLVLLALAALFFTGLLTRGLTRAGGPRGHAGS
jgi:hypothetical protein